MRMWNNIIVPLDGSELSAQALPAARLMALAAGSDLTLARAYPAAPQWQADVGHGRYRGSLAAAEHDRIAAFLMSEKRRLEGSGVATPIHLAAREGHPAEVIAALADRDPGALIVMSTHGRGGFSRMLMGSVTARVVRAVKNPTLIVRCNELDCPVVPPSFDHIIVPLDGSAFAEHSLPYAAALALAFDAGVTLLRCSQRPEYFRAHTEWTRLNHEAGFQFGGPAEMSAGLAARSRAYLQGKADELHTRFGIPNANLVNSLESPADAVIGLGDGLPNALVVMTTHGRRGVGRALLGSVADQVVRHSLTPTLLVREPMRARQPAAPLREMALAAV